MRSFFKYFLYSLAIVIPIFFAFKNIFIFKPLAGGDAPFFYSEGLKELISEPMSWTSRGNNFGGQNLIIWLSPLTILYGLLGSLFKLGNDVAVRLIFYLPSIVLSVVGGYSFSRYLKFSHLTSFFAALFYVLNTYFIVLIDGGQVGVALAYAIFPFTLIALKKLFDSPSLNYFYIALVAFFINGLADPRITLISIITVIAWIIIESLSTKKIIDLKKLFIFIPLVFVWACANLFWIYPLIMNTVSAVSGQNFNFTSLLSSLFVFQPHYPGNQFGKVNPPPFYFFVLPSLIFVNFFIKERDIKEQKRLLVVLTSLVLVLMFVVKGGNPPIGEWYSWLVENVTLGSSFRDSTKFFVPLVLFAGILIGNAISFLSSKMPNNFFGKLTLVTGYLLLISLVYPSLFGRMNFVLSNKDGSNDSSKIYQEIRRQDGFFRTAYFSEHQPTSFESNQKPLIDGKNLVNLMPFRSMNVGEDVFNFVNNPNFVGWFRVLGIKYIFLPGNPRDLLPSKTEIENWTETKNIVDSTQGLTKLSWDTSFAGYEIPNPGPRMWVADRLIGVVGPQSENIDKQLAPSVYFEDEKFNPRLLEGKDANSVKIFFNGKEQVDLTMSFLKKYITTTTGSGNNKWAVYKPGEYLKAKYELLIRGVEYKDFDYGLGLSFSTIAGEKMDVPLTATVSGEYILGVRSMSVTDSGGLRLSFNKIDNDISSKKTDFGWHTFGPFKLDKGVHRAVFQNTGGLQVVNALALIPKDSFSEAEKLSTVFVKHFGLINENQINVKNLGEAELLPEGTLKTKFNVPTKGNWLIVSDSYDPLWHLRKGTEFFESVPVYASINGFYFEPKWNDVHVEFGGQDNVRWGIYGSICSILMLSIIYFWFLSKDGKD